MTKILGIESSCDETAIAVYDSENGLLANTIYSQIELHKLYGGVVPELAARDHVRKIIPLIDECLEATKITLENIDAIAYTAGPGLNGALLVGASVANSLAYASRLPLIPIHHLEGHLLSPFLANDKPSTPFVALLVSGGHSQLIAVKKIGEYELLGDTLDDAAGEAFDKTAKMLGISDYPGGKYIAQLAISGSETYNLPRPMLGSGDLMMSFSGLKTAVAVLIQNLTKDNIKIEGQVLANLAKSIEEAITDVLIKKSMLALKQTRIKNLVVCGGVSSNLTLRNKLTQETTKNNYQVYYPPLEFCTDNGAMIALAGSFRFGNNCVHKYSFTVHPRFDLTNSPYAL